MVAYYQYILCLCTNLAKQPSDPMIFMPPIWATQRHTYIYWCWCVRITCVAVSVIVHTIQIISFLDNALQYSSVTEANWSNQLRWIEKIHLTSRKIEIQNIWWWCGTEWTLFVIWSRSICETIELHIASSLSLWKGSELSFCPFIYSIVTVGEVRVFNLIQYVFCNKDEPILMRTRISEYVFVCVSWWGVCGKERKRAGKIQRQSDVVSRLCMQSSMICCSWNYFNRIIWNIRLNE